MKTKYFDSKIYKTEQNMKNTIIIIITFLLGIYIGLLINYSNLQQKEKEKNELEVQLDDKNEVITRLNKDKNNLETILNNYTIEERKGE